VSKRQEDAIALGVGQYLLAPQEAGSMAQAGMAQDGMAEAESPIRIGFIGCGGNARGHLRRLAQVPGATIAGVCDVEREAAERAAGETSAQAYTDFRQLLDRTDLDAVYLSLPVFAHGAPDLAVVERGLPFFVEKPVAIDLGTAQQIGAALQRTQLISCVGYQLRYCGSADVARELLAAPDAGPTGLTHGTYWCGIARAQPTHWRTRLAQSGGQLLEQATHTIDMMRYLVGDVTEVFAYFNKQILGAGEGGDCPDVHAVALRFANGAVGTLSTTWAIEPTDWGQANVVDIAYGEHRLQWRPTGVSVTRGRESNAFTRPDGNIDAVFVQAVRTGDRSAIRSDYFEGIRNLTVPLAANESARTGAPVKVASP
jgi:predicted dehydrogenase